ncbi:MAG: hypothetical protein ACLT9P_04855 [Evtepia gabavorous]
MNVTIQPGAVAGTVAAIPSKSAAHRLLICAALADRPTRVICPQLSQDIAATVRCLEGLGAQLRRQGEGYEVIPLDRTKPVGTCLLDCGESGSTLRFLLPVAGALGAEATVRMAGRLAQRPLGPLVEQLRKGGCAVTLWEEEKRLTISGQLRPGEYHLPGDVSSQFISGMLFALPPAAGWQPVGGGGRAGVGQLSPADSPGPGDLWPDAQRAGGGLDDCFPGVRQPRRGTGGGGLVQRGPLALPGHAGGEGVTVTGMDLDSLQGDRAVCRVLAAMGDRSVPPPTG